MSDRLYYLFFGPVMRREYRRLARGPVPLGLTYLYFGWLLLLSIGYWGDGATGRIESPLSLRQMQMNQTLGGAISSAERDRLLRAMELELKRDKFLHAIDTATAYIKFLLHQQLALIVFAVPLLTAGAVVYEKEKDTLQALFCTDLSATEIVLGKLLGRLAVFARASLAILPPLFCAAALVHLPVGRIFLALLQAALLAFALGASCLLLSLWARRASDAIIGSYAAIIVVYLLVQVALGAASVPIILNPLSILDQLLSTKEDLRLTPIVVHLFTWAAVGGTCFAFVASRLRPVSIGLMDARPARRLWALRPPVGNDPIRWRELHIIGLAPLPGLRRIPRWLGLLSVLVFSGIIAGDALTRAVRRDFFDRLLAFEFATLRVSLQAPNLAILWYDIHLMGSVLLVLACLTVGVRCAGSILEEKRRKTWEDLILTPMTLEEIVRGKYRGIVQAAILPAALYALPMLALSSLGGPAGIRTAMAWLGATCVLIPLAGKFGINVANETETETGAHRLRQQRMPYHRSEVDAVGSTSITTKLPATQGHFIQRSDMD
jgi:ABC-type transport system involved in multi-copper enzyme maturation permease subunit